jgi:cytochrome c peroxidase
VNESVEIPTEGRILDVNCGTGAHSIELAVRLRGKGEVVGVDPRKATPAELRGQAVFFGKGACASCHVPPYYTDNLMHNLQAERFFKPVMINGMMAIGDGPIKTFPLRGIKDSPPYMHDGRLLTVDDTVEFFNLILGTQLTDQEKKDLVVFLRAL